MARTARKLVAVKDEGVVIAADADSINFQGGGVSGTAPDSKNVTEVIPGTDDVIYAEPITIKDAPTFTYTLGKLTGIAYASGTTKTITYNGDGTLNTLTITYPGVTPIVKTAHWSSGVLQSISIT